MGETNATPKLRLQGVSKSFLSPRATSPTLVVSDISLDIGSGEFVCIVGPSGCGKSTVMNMIAGLEPQDAGAIELDGRAVQGPGAERARVPTLQQVLGPVEGQLDGERLDQ